MRRSRSQQFVDPLATGCTEAGEEALEQGLSAAREADEPPLGLVPGGSRVNKGGRAVVVGPTAQEPPRREVARAYGLPDIAAACPHCMVVVGNSIGRGYWQRLHALASGESLCGEEDCKPVLLLAVDHGGRMPARLVEKVGAAADAMRKAEAKRARRRARRLVLKVRSDG